jgi:drug/metabolite transporter (DMT)-like permease
MPLNQNSQQDYLLLILLSAIWGSSFIFMRLLAPVFGAAGTASLRLLIAAVFLIVLFYFTGYKINWKRDAKLLFFLGLINSALPFYLYAYAALHIPASLSVIINAMSPMFGALFASLILKDRLTPTKVAGLFMGTLGVGLMSGSKSLPQGPQALVALGACLLAAACYGLGSTFVKKYGTHLEARSLAAGSQLFAGLSLLPFFLLHKVDTPITVPIVSMLLIFGIVCSALAYLIYYRIIKTLGPTKALTVTFLMPVFGVVWSNIFLAEPLYSTTLFSGLIILIGTFLVMKPYALKKA